MKRIATNSLTGWAVALLVFYVVISLTIPDFYVAVGVRLSMFLGGAAALWKWWPAFRILLDRENPPHDRGEVLSTLGIATFSLGVVYNVVWWVVWLAFGAQPHWLVTAHSAAGNYLVAIGLTLVFRSTDIRRDVVRPVNWWIVVAAILLAAMVGAVAGAKWQETQQAALTLRFSEASMRCPADRPIAGNKSRAGWIYHTRQSPWYELVVPEACYRTEHEARVAGYRPPSQRQ